MLSPSCHILLPLFYFFFPSHSSTFFFAFSSVSAARAWQPSLHMHLVKITAVITSPRLLVKHTQLSSSRSSSNNADSASLRHTQTNVHNGLHRKAENFSFPFAPIFSPLVSCKARVANARAQKFRRQ
ncbi:hypothetical protein M441DRAFT_372230 [Trichoderma asperellum CBS 433.97]|uniref:Uncharacterized protein n=1 Tax=Trichoderma asperellum (strain ATCC 204424 / CBS 433.97 / NBRC 101777) TaxID=1042311 RepID=A0A2T3ZF54_TRIA4|nr:hypothetical protein M441DRAFT_372230 [Trichoderma asperellum CBS 433.97]PTB43419.1 hypothetical protein M441DRAFT_372230 [Trichoderma asperellum CBS 433.97]WVH32802.1 hypothetical protein [Trichoderma asperellum]